MELQAVTSIWSSQLLHPQDVCRPNTPEK